MKTLAKLWWFLCGLLGIYEVPTVASEVVGHDEIDDDPRYYCADCEQLNGRRALPELSGLELLQWTRRLHQYDLQRIRVWPNNEWQNVDDEPEPRSWISDDYFEVSVPLEWDDDTVEIYARRLNR